MKDLEKKIIFMLEKKIKLCVCCVCLITIMVLKFVFRCFFELCGMYSDVNLIYKPPKKNYWAILKKYVKTRVIVLFWMELTQKNLCSLGGRGRNEDMMHYISDFS